MKQIGFIGLGKLGLDSAEVFAEQHTVRGYDIYPRHSDLVKVCDISEVVEQSEWIFIAVPTPHAEGYDGSSPSSHGNPFKTWLAMGSPKAPSAEEIKQLQIAAATTEADSPQLTTEPDSVKMNIKLPRQSVVLLEFTP